MNSNSSPNNQQLQKYNPNLSNLIRLNINNLRDLQQYPNRSEPNLITTYRARWLIISYSGNYHYYQMGCGACVGDHNVSAPVGYASDLESALFWNIKKDLKPCQLVRHTEFDEVTKQLQQSALAHKKRKRITQQEPQQQQLPTLTEEQKLRIKWKLLVFCYHDDFYEPQEYDTIKLGLEHPCFPQIEKDLQRTFPSQKFFQSPQGISIFQRLLKRIALYFPSLGYTQGINFIVGYLLVLEFTEEETFWLVVHMAMSPRFLLLGFFEDGFPMSSIYCNFMNYVFRENIPDLYDHFEELGVAGEAWMFKWFMTYYLYSFPMEIAKEVWTLIMLKGGIGMIYFGFAILKELEKELIQFDEATEIIGFLQNLKDASTFHSLIDVKSLIQRAYSIVMSDQQMQRVTKQFISQSQVSNFYTKFFSLSTSKQNQREVLEQWHQKLRKERIQFRTNEKIVIQQSTGIRIKKAVPQSNNTSSKVIKPTRESRFRIKQEQFKKTKQKNFLEKSMKMEQENASITNRSKVSSKHSKTSHVIQIQSISNNLHASNHSSSIKRHQHQMSRMQSQQSFMIDDANSSSNRQYTEQDISDGEVTARNASVHVINKNINNNSRPSKEEEVEIFQLHQPFKKKKEGMSQRNQSGRINQRVIYLPESIQNLNKKQSQKTVIEIGPTNIIYRQETIYSIDPSEHSIIEFETSSNNVGGESLDLRYRTPQTVKSHQGTIEHG